MNESERLSRAFDREIASTARVLEAFPQGSEWFRPHPRSRTALALSWVILAGVDLAIAVASDALGQPTPARHWPTTLPAAAEGLLEQGAALATVFAGRGDLSGSVLMPSGSNRSAEMSKNDLLWTALSDQIHHRGQLTVYLRLCGGRVPSVYGPTADETW